jgi:hypothetical protein
MGQRRLSNGTADDQSKRPHAPKKSNNTVLNNTSTRKGEVHSVALAKT